MRTVKQPLLVIGILELLWVCLELLSSPILLRRRRFFSFPRWSNI